MSKTSIKITPVTPTIGAEMEGFDLRAIPDDDSLLETVKCALQKHLVLFFRDQQLCPASLQAIGRRIGPLHRHPQGDIEGFDGVISVHTDRNSTTFGGSKWHADATCDSEPPTASLLYMEKVPNFGGDTLFANVHAAFETLSVPMKKFLEELTAVHTSARHYGGYFGTARENTRDGSFPESIHPVVAVHPESGRKALYVNEIFTASVCELEPAESTALLGFLFAHISHPRFQCRFKWRTHSAALWDNRATQHLAVWDYWPETRSGLRVTMQGAMPPKPVRRDC